MKKNELDELENRGDFCFLDNGTIAVQYGDDPVRDITILPITEEADCGMQWHWDGNLEEPTLSPSIRVHAYEGWTKGWHGFLRAGELVDA